MAWVVTCCAVLLAGSTREEPRRPDLCLTALDVGQGDALLVEPPEGMPWLVDGGGAPGSRYDVGLHRVVPALRARGIDRLGLVVMTHEDEDHAGGLFAVLEQLEVDALLVPRRRGLGATGRSLVSLAAGRGVPVLVADEGAELPTIGGGAAARLLHPRGESRGLGTNDASVVLALRFGAVPFLLTGDIEAEGEGRLLASRDPLRSAVLKLAHHGSRTSTSERWLDAVQPLVGVAGLGADNRFGFPHHAVTRRLQERGVPLFSTAERGEVRVCSDGLGLRVDTGETGRWEEALVLEPATVGAWALRPPAHRPGEVSGDVRSQRAAPSDSLRGGRAARARGAKKTQRRGRRESKRAEDEAVGRRARPPRRPGADDKVEPPPTLLPDREWSRSRRDRGRPRPPWKSRR